MILTKQEELMAGGKFGPGIEKCMDILIKMGQIFGAKKMIPVTSAHTMPKEPPELLKSMTKGVKQTAVFTTLHPIMSAFDPKVWQKMGISKQFAARELAMHQQRTEVHKRLGFCQTYTCLPMFAGNLPRKDDCISWIGSGAQLLANSVIGARTNRDGTLVNLAIAITGRAPYTGLYLDENRYADVLVVLDGLNPHDLSDVDFGAIGYYVGGIAQNRSIVIDNLPRELSWDQLKYLMAPLSTSGSVSICHIVGLTPEAPTREQALGYKKPSEIISVGAKQIAQTKALYAIGGQEKIDMVILGCPHCLIPEIKHIASLLEGKKIGNNQKFWIGMPHQIYHLAQIMGYTKIIEGAGGVITRSCMAAIPDFPIPEGVQTIATNSFKAAHYISRLAKEQVHLVIGTIDKCVEAAITGKWNVDVG